MELTERTIHPFSINSRVYEQEMDQKHGLILASILNNGKETKGDLAREYFYEGNEKYSTIKISKRILQKYQNIPGFCSMIIKDGKELNQHLEKIYRLLYAHYLYGKKINFKGTFPEKCCGRSSRNILLDLMEKGYPNATFFYNESKDHAYTGLPFIFGENQEPGFIIADPTSDQSFNDKRSAPRNNIFIASGNKWIYQPGGEKGLNLFPNRKDKSVFSNLETLRIAPNKSIKQSSRIKKYFAEVFKHPVQVNIGDF
jgi:hypothetical protein